MSAGRTVHQSAVSGTNGQPIAVRRAESRFRTTLQVLTGSGIFNDPRGFYASKEVRVEITYYDHGTEAERWERAQKFFEAKDYASAARVLSRLVEEVPEQTGPRLLLARSYYHSAQLRRAEAELRTIVERDPVEHYARLMLGRTLERQARHDEAEQHLRIAAALAGDFPQD